MLEEGQSLGRQKNPSQSSRSSNQSDIPGRHTSHRTHEEIRANRPTLVGALRKLAVGRYRGIRQGRPIVVSRWALDSTTATASGFCKQVALGVTK
jgi:hypothetical protein